MAGERGLWPPYTSGEPPSTTGAAFEEEDRPQDGVALSIATGTGRACTGWQIGREKAEGPLRSVRLFQCLCAARGHDCRICFRFTTNL